MGEFVVCLERVHRYARLMQYSMDRHLAHTKHRQIQRTHSTSARQATAAVMLKLPASSGTSRIECHHNSLGVRRF